MAITAKDKNGTYGRQRRAEGPALDRSTARYYAVVQNVWNEGRRTKREAEADEHEMQGRARQGVRLAKSAMPFGEYLDAEWLPMVDGKVALGDLKPTTASHYRIIVESYVRPAIGSIRLRDVKPTTLRKFYADLAGKRGLGSKSIRNVHVLISNALSLAVSDGYLPSNPAKGRDVVPTGRSREMKCWDADETRKFLATAADDRLFAAWRIVATCGLRRGELLALRWADLDFHAGTLRVERALVVDPNTHKFVFQSPKTERSRRTIDLDSVTVDAIKRHRVAQAQERLAAGDAWAEGDLVFSNEIGEPIRPETFARRFHALVKVAGVTRIRVHDVRHTAASLALQAGVPLHVVSDMLGHATSSITLDVYSHVLRGQRTDAAERIAAAIDG